MANASPGPSRSSDSCEWGDWECEYDCDNPEHVMRRNKDNPRMGWTFHEDRNCYEVPEAKHFEKYKGQDNWDAFVDSVHNTENWIKDGEIDPDFKSLDRNIREKIRYGGSGNKWKRKWKQFVNHYAELTSKMSRAKSVPGSCTLEFCSPNFPTDFIRQRVQECVPQFYYWATWGEWGQCDRQCGSEGPEGQRKRYRTCFQKECPDKPIEQKGACKPSRTFDGSEGLKDTDTAGCSPCG